MNNWIKTADRFPQIGTMILYFADTIYMGLYDGIGLKAGHFTHWQYVPDPPYPPQD